MLKTAKQNLRHLYASALFYLKRAPLPDCRFIIFGRGRSGSTALVSLLDGVEGIHCDGEILNRRVLFPRLHIDACCAKSGAKAYGCKILSYQLRDVQPIARPDDFLMDLHKSGYKIIYLRRLNLLHHALSNIRARRYGFHRRKGKEEAKGQAMTVDPREVLDWIQKSEALDRFEKDILQDIPFYELTYEEHLQDEAVHQHTVDKVCKFLGVEPTFVSCTYEKVAPKGLDKIVANFSDLEVFLRGTPYGRFVEDI